MKIGILTYHRAHNYGAMLQAYALLTFLKEQGHEVEFIDYWPYSHQQQYKLLKPLHGKHAINKFVNIIVDCLTIVRRLSRIRKFNSFAYNFLGLNSQIKYKDPTDKVAGNLYDYIIVGSDQVWRNHEYEGKYVGFDPFYFCQSVSTNIHCISYAASMGIITLNEKDRSQLQEYLKAFDTILVRENSLKTLINSLNYDAEVVLDPTLLLSKNQWNKLLPTSRFYKEKYVLYYELIKSSKAMAYAINKAKSLNCKLLIMDASIRTIPRNNHIAFASPIEFMHAIRDAEYIIATSFHGTAFSIIFEKQFITIGLSKNADRVQTLLQHLNIEEHYQNDPINVPDINYSRATTLLNNARTQSIRLLLSALTKQ